MGVEASRRKRWRFQFSLRALMLAVFAYVGLWGLTVAFAPRVCAQRMAEKLCGKFDGKQTIVVEEIQGEFESRWQYTTHARVPAPFVVWFDCKDGDFIRYDEGTFIWCFGALWTMKDCALIVPQSAGVQQFTPDATWVVSE